MVYLGFGEDRAARVPAPPPPASMAMGPERSKPLHNFTLPCLKWGNQRYLRCMKVTADADADAAVVGAATEGENRRYPPMRSENSAATRKRELEAEKKPASARDLEKKTRISKSRIDSDEEDGIEAVREKIMFDLKTAADKMKDAILRKEVAEDNDDEDDDQEREPPAASSPAPPAAPASASVAAPVEARPWNLRTRRAACKAPIVAGGSGKGLKIEEKKLNNHSPLRTDGNIVKSPKLRISPEKAERPKFSVPLSRKEIEEDFMAMVGHRPPRRPKKRNRNVQKDLDTLFPGLWLSEVTVDSYKVAEAPDNGKK